MELTQCLLTTKRACVDLEKEKIIKLVSIMQLILTNCHVSLQQCNTLEHSKTQTRINPSYPQIKHIRERKKTPCPLGILETARGNGGLLIQLNFCRYSICFLTPSTDNSHWVNFRVYFKNYYTVDAENVFLIVVLFLSTKIHWYVKIKHWVYLKNLLQIEKF